MQMFCKRNAKALQTSCKHEKEDKKITAGMTYRYRFFILTATYATGANLTMAPAVSECSVRVSVSPLNDSKYRRDYLASKHPDTYH